MANTIFYLILGIIVVDFIFERWLDYLNQSHFKPELPAELENIYERDKYKKSQQYLKANGRFTMISASFSFILIILMLVFHGFAKLDEIVRYLTPNIYLRTLLFFAVLGLGADILLMPFQIYDTFVIEEKFGFNKTTVSTFIVDKLKMWMMAGIIGGGLLIFLQWAQIVGGSIFWLIALGGIGIFMIFMAMFYTSIVVPLFNKLTPLRSTKANAYFSGLGPKKKIILYDTLIRELTPKEVVAVLAHEIGHYRKKHIYKGLALSLIQLFILTFLLGKALVLPQFSQALGAQQMSFYMGLTAFFLLYSPVSFVLDIFMNLFSRKHEYQADAYAAKQGLGKDLVNALIKLSVSSLSNLQPHPLYLFFHYSHPTLLQRKKAIEKQVNTKLF